MARISHGPPCSSESVLVPRPLTKQEVQNVQEDLDAVLSTEEGQKFLSFEVIEAIAPYIPTIISDSAHVWMKGYDADYHFHQVFVGNHEVMGYSHQLKIKVKAVMLTTLALTLRRFNCSLDGLLWTGTDELVAAYRHCEAYDLLNKHSTVEWASLLAFRNGMVIVREILKEFNKNLMEMSAGIMSNFFLCMSGGKPSKQVIRRHAIYHKETNTTVKPRNAVTPRTARKKYHRRKLTPKVRPMYSYTPVTPEASVDEEVEYTYHNHYVDESDCIPFKLIDEVTCNTDDETVFSEMAEEDFAFLPVKRSYLTAALAGTSRAECSSPAFAFPSPGKLDLGVPLPPERMSSFGRGGSFGFGLNLTAFCSTPHIYDGSLTDAVQMELGDTPVKLLDDGEAAAAQGIECK